MSLNVPRRSRLTRQQALRTAQPSKTSFGARFGGETLTHIPAEANIRPLRDQIILEPRDVKYSKWVLVNHDTKPLRGKVLAIGPGTYHWKYDHPEKQRRTRMWKAKHFTPCDVKVGDVVELGGAEISGFAFETLFWGDKFCLICAERDVCGVVDEGEAHEPAQTL